MNSKQTVNVNKVNIFYDIVLFWLHVVPFDVRFHYNAFICVTG